jgi:aspartate 1-decarboxylase
MFKSKIHRATVTHADLEYEGSVSIDAELLEAADILPYEEVFVWNLTNGSRISTYALEAEPGSRVICINGAAAHRNAPGDRVILATFAELEAEEIAAHEPTVVLVDRENRVVDPALQEIAGPKRRRA